MLWRSSPVSSATWASSRGLPAASSAGAQAVAGTWPITVWTRSSKSNPTEVVHLGARRDVQRAEVGNQCVGGPGVIAGDQHPAAVRGGDPRDRLGQDFDVIGGGVGPGPPRAQLDHQRLVGVVASGGQRMKLKRLQVGPACCFSLCASTIEASNRITVTSPRSPPATPAGGICP